MLIYEFIGKKEAQEEGVSKSTMFRQRKQQLFKSFRLSPKVFVLRPSTATSFLPSAAPGNGSKYLGTSRLSGSGQSSVQSAKMPTIGVSASSARSKQMEKALTTLRSSLSSNASRTVTFFSKTSRHPYFVTERRKENPERAAEVIPVEDLIAIYKSRCKVGQASKRVGQQNAGHQTPVRPVRRSHAFSLQ